MYFIPYEFLSICDLGMRKIKDSVMRTNVMTHIKSDPKFLTI